MNGGLIRDRGIIERGEGGGAYFKSFNVTVILKQLSILLINEDWPTFKSFNVTVILKQLSILLINEDWPTLSAV